MLAHSRQNQISPYLRWALLGVFTLWVLLDASAAFAQTSAPTIQIMDKIGLAYTSKTFRWSEIIRVYAIRLFLLLAVIDFCWLCATFIFEKKELDDMMHSVSKKLMSLSFFFFLLMSSNTWIPQIINSFSQIGKEAGEISTASVATPDGIATIGFDTAMGVFLILGDLRLGEKLAAAFPATIIALLIFLAFLWTAAQLLIAQIEASFAIGAGIILMGFGGSRWTMDMATKYKQYVVATGFKLMLMYIVVGTGATLYNDMKLVSGDGFLSSLYVALGSALMYGFLATKVPAIASGMMSGSPSMTAGDMMGAVVGAAAAVAGMGAAGAALGKAGAGALGGGAAAATGVGQAIGAGLEAGRDMGKSGASLAAHALGEVGSHGLGLAAGAIGDRMASGKANFGEQVANSAGGRVATGIQASRGGSMAGVSGSGGAAPQSSSSSPQSGPSSASAESGSPDSSAAGTPGARTGAPSAPASTDATKGAGPAQTGSSSGSSSNGTQASMNTPTSAQASDGERAANSSGAANEVPHGSPAPDMEGASSAPAVPGPSLSVNSQGDASTGVLSGGGEKTGGGDTNPPGPQQRYRDPLHHRIRELKGYVPDDAAQAATLQININHTQ